MLETRLCVDQVDQVDARASRSTAAMPDVAYDDDDESADNNDGNALAVHVVVHLRELDDDGRAFQVRIGVSRVIFSKRKIMMEWCVSFTDFSLLTYGSIRVRIGVSRVIFSKQKIWWNDVWVLLIFLSLLMAVWRNAPEWRIIFSAQEESHSMPAGGIDVCCGSRDFLQRHEDGKVFATIFVTV